jgi:hypothetical protein
MDSLPRLVISLVASVVITGALTDVAQAQVQSPQPPPAPAAPTQPEPTGPQPPQPPITNRRRAVRGLFGGGPPPDMNRVRNEFALTASFLGGYDDNASPTGGPGSGSSAIDPRLTQSAYTGQADIGFEYVRAKLTRMFTLGGRGYFNDYRDLDLGVTSGGDVRVAVTSPFGRSVTGRANAAYSSDPQYDLSTRLPGVGEILASSVDAPPISPAISGLNDARSNTAFGGFGLDWQAAQRSVVGVTFNYYDRTYTGTSSGSLGDSSGYRAGVSLGQTLSRHTRMRTVYEYGDSTVREVDVDRPSKEHRIEVGPAYERRLSPSRTLRLSGSLGAVRVETLSTFGERLVAYWSPSGSGSVDVDLARSWQARGDYRREISVLDGLVPQTYLTDNLTASVAGYLNQRTRLELATDYVTGRAPENPQLNEFSNAGARVHTRVALTRYLAMTAEYYFYRYHFADPEVLPESLPQRFTRNAVRVGFTLWLPLLAPPAAAGSH